jgi:hypothetical protein
MLTTVWGAPRHAYTLTENLAAGDREAYEFVWRSLGSTSRADVVIVLGAQARLAALLAQTCQGTPFRVPAGHWDRIACPHMRAFAIDAWAGTKAARLPRHPCEYCLRVAAEALAELHLTALAAAGLPRARLADICGQDASWAR